MSSGLAKGVDSARRLEDLARGWLDSSGPRRPKQLPLTVTQQLQVLLDTSTEIFSASLTSLQRKSIVSAVSSYRFLTESLVVCRWILEPSDPSIREARCGALSVGALSRLKRLSEKAGPEEVLRPLREAARVLIKRAEERMREARPPLENSRIPSRSELFNHYLPGGYVLFSAISELASHPGPLSIVSLVSADVEGDALFWLSVTYATFVSVLAEVAFGLGHTSWMEGLEETVDNVDGVVAMSWPSHLQPRRSAEGV